MEPNRKSRLVALVTAGDGGEEPACADLVLAMESTPTGDAVDRIVDVLRRRINASPTALDHPPRAPYAQAHQSGFLESRDDVRRSILSMRTFAPPQPQPHGPVVSGGTRPDMATPRPHPSEVPLRLPRAIGSHGRGHDFGKVPVHPPAAGAMRAALATVIEQRQVGGTELRGDTRTALERAFDVDLGAVRVHADTAAGRLSRALGAQAFAAGQHIFFGPGAYNPASADGRRLLTHELAHVVQPGGAGSGRLTLSKADDPTEREADQVGESVAKALEAGLVASAVPPPPLAVQQPRASGAALTVQRRLIATGDIRDIVDFIFLVAPAIGLTLVHDPQTHEITAIGPGDKPATSLELRAVLTTVMDDPLRNAEINIGKGQPEVGVGAFPAPEDLSGGKVQAIDIDDTLNIEAGAPGSGLAKVGHEIIENYHAHSLTVVAGTSRFSESHRVGLAAEDRIAREIVGPGRRVASVLVEIGGNRLTMVEDHETYFLVYTLTRRLATRGLDVSNARRASRAKVSTRRIDGFDIGSPAVPAAGDPTIAAVVADLAANPTATVRIEGFSDGQAVPTRSPVDNVARARQWAEGTRDAILAAGASGDKEGFNLIALGAMTFVAPNDTEANRARNRRVVITVERPGR